MSRGDRTVQDVMDMVGNLTEWVADSYYDDEDDEERDAVPRGATRRGASKHFIAGQGFLSSLHNVYTPSVKHGFPTDFQGKGFGFRCASEPSRPLLNVANFPCPELAGPLRVEALERLRVYHAAIADGRFGDAALIESAMLNRLAVDEAQIAFGWDREDLAEMFRLSSSRAKRIFESSVLAPLPPDEKITFTCKNWAYTATSDGGLPVIRAEGDLRKNLPFCIARWPAPHGWGFAC